MKEPSLENVTAGVEGSGASSGMIRNPAPLVKSGYGEYLVELAREERRG